VVTSFQVLEHVTDPRQFLLDMAAAAKPGGRVMIGVPNSGGFVGRDPRAVLNAPPHHMGLWSRTSLERVAEIVGLRVERMEVEPLNTPDWFQATVEREYLPAGWKAKLFYRLGGAQVLRRAITDYATSIAGHTILAIYRRDAAR
jgi:2-polyprenyl-3-methyl-5-hydroxy-6-metoxy-1,4-benzoquinol methylase